MYDGGGLHFNMQEIPPPANDDFANATIISALPFSNIVDNSGATLEPNEPQPSEYLPKTVWYSFTPANNAMVRADMAGSSWCQTNFNIYQAGGSGITDLIFLSNAAWCNNSNTFSVGAGITYYFQVGYMSGDVALQFNLREILPPANDNFENATSIAVLPFDDTVDIAAATVQVNEPTPSCAYNGLGNRSVWYAFTPTASESVSASIPAAAFAPVFATYTGSSLAGLSEVGCQIYSGNMLTFHVNAGITYYFQIVNLYPGDQGGSVQFHLDVAPLPVAGLGFYPSDPSVFDTIQFNDQSYDPGGAGFETFTWDFGDGTTSIDPFPTHRYAKDGDYTIQHSVTTGDDRSASTSQVVQVRTHDVAIAKVSAPMSANARQTRTITISINNKRYPENVEIVLFKSIPGGFQVVGSYIQFVPVRPGNRTSTFTFNYTFTKDDASIGKVTFKAVATIVNARDALPADNEAISYPPTKIGK